LVMNGNTMEIWWRKVVSGNTQLLRKTSTDGKTWSESEIMFQSLTYGKDILSPSIIFDGTKYRLWGISSGIVYNESVDGKTWSLSSEVKINVNWGNITPWHMDIITSEK